MSDLGGNTVSTLGGSPTQGDGNGERGSADWPEEAAKAEDVAEADISEHDAARHSRD